MDGMQYDRLANANHASAVCALARGGIIMESPRTGCRHATIKVHAPLQLRSSLAFNNGSHIPVASIRPALEHRF